MTDFMQYFGGPISGEFCEIKSIDDARGYYTINKHEYTMEKIRFVNICFYIYMHKEFILNEENLIKGGVKIPKHAHPYYPIDQKIIEMGL